MASNAKSTPRDAQVMAAILKDMGVVEFEPRLINQMLEFAYRYVTDILDDAKVYSQHANKKNLDTEDVKLAVQCRTDQSFTNPPVRDMLQEIARQKNSQPLPAIKPYGGPRLLPDRYCLTAINFRLKSAKKPVSQPRIQFGLPSQQRISLASSGKGIVKNIGGSGGQSLTMVPKAGGVSGAVSAGQVTIISKPVVATPKPTIRINTGQTAGIGASGLAQMVTQSATPSSSFPSASSLLSSGVLSSATSLPASSVLPPSTSGPTISFNPLKRKAEDDDYDA
ncbi:hypothetical protein V1264_004078 [Littorina saxatilis]|uniref:Transcription initiation factor TFIID subunit 9 n=2 Tax=Littorina saxatilis TaxID=31220 RepID=A0AAN9B1A0_9CAEN